MKKIFQERKFSTFLLSIFFIVNIISIVQKVTQGFNRDIFNDDAYYYLLTAINHINYGFYSFDTINPTNGFHPLFEWLETALFFIIGIDHSRQWLYLGALLFIGGLLAVFLIVFTIYSHGALARKDVYKTTHIYVLLALISLLFGQYLHLYINGMESVLVVILASLLSILLVDKKNFLASIAAMFLVLARLDTLIYFVLPLFLLFSVLQVKDKGSISYGIKFLGLLLLPTLIATLSYMLYNYLVFDHFKPIHGYLKSTFPHLNPQLFLISRPHFYYILGFSLLGTLLSAKENYAFERLRILGIAFGAITMVYLLNYYLFQKWSKPIPPWYLSLLYFTSYGSFFIGVSNFIRLRHLKIITVLLILFFLFCGIKDAHRESQAINTGNLGNTQLFNFLKSLPEESILANTDCGKRGFWSERKTINLDGLINNFEYQQYLKEGMLAKYLEDKNVDYLIIRLWDRKQTEQREYEPMYRHRVNLDAYNGDYDFHPYYLYSYMYNSYSDIIKLHKCSEIYRSTDKVFDGRALSRIIIYDLNKNMTCYK